MVAGRERNGRKEGSRGRSGQGRREMYRRGKLGEKGKKSWKQSIGGE